MLGAPLRNVGLYMFRRFFDLAATPGLQRPGRKGRRREAVITEDFVNSLGRVSPLPEQRRIDNCGCAVIFHAPGLGGQLTQRIINQIAYGGAVTGPCESMAVAP